MNHIEQALESFDLSKVVLLEEPLVLELVQDLSEYMSHYFQENFSDFSPEGLTLENLTQELKKLTYICGLFIKIQQHVFKSESIGQKLAQNVHGKLESEVAKYLKNAQELATQISGNEHFSRFKDNPLLLFTSPKLYQQEQYAELSFLVDAFKHDVENVVGTLYSRASLCLELAQENDFTLQSIEPDLKSIQESLTIVVMLLRAFNLKEGSIVREPERVTQLFDYMVKIRNSAGSDYRNKLEQAKKDPTLRKIDNLQVLVKLEVDDSLGEEYFSLLNIPAFLRIYINAVQNTKKAYLAKYLTLLHEAEKIEAELTETTDQMSERSEELQRRANHLRSMAEGIDPQLTITASFKKMQSDVGEQVVVAMVFEDRAGGFPLGNDVQQQTQIGFNTHVSRLDPSVRFVRYAPSLRRTQWAGGVTGTGVGLASYEVAIDDMGGVMNAGTVIENNQPVGARIEVIMSASQNS